MNFTRAYGIFLWLWLGILQYPMSLSLVISKKSTCHKETTSSSVDHGVNYSSNNSLVSITAIIRPQLHHNDCRKNAIKCVRRTRRNASSSFYEQEKTRLARSTNKKKPSCDGVRDMRLQSIYSNDVKA